jgi:hypothetical protein
MQEDAAKRHPTPARPIAFSRSSTYADPHYALRQRFPTRISGLIGPHIEDELRCMTSFYWPPKPLTILDTIERAPLIVLPPRKAESGIGRRPNIFPYVISLPERLNNAVSVVNDRLLLTDAQFFRAVCKKRLNFGRLLQLNMVHKMYANPNDSGRVACAMSHYACMLDFLRRNPAPDEFMLLFEDDIAIAPGVTPHDVRNYIASATYELKKMRGGRENDGSVGEIVFLGYYYAKRKFSSSLGSGVMRIRSATSGHAMMLNPAACRLILFDAFPMIAAQDTVIQKLMETDKIRAVGPVKNLLDQDQLKFGSTVNQAHVPPQFVN